MKQQINLFQAGLIEKKAPLHAGMMFGALVFSCMLLLVISFALWWQQRTFDSELVRLNAQQAELAADLQVLTLQNPPRQKDPSLTQRLTQLQGEYAGRKPILAYLDNFNSDKASGFSPLIKGFAQYPLQGVWLTDLRLNSSENKILLAGSALKADLVPAYLQHLGANKVLNEQTFASLKVMRTPENKHQVDFRFESNFGDSDE
jgi:Tfp pilus assembly protein PilN